MKLQYRNAMVFAIALTMMFAGSAFAVDIPVADWAALIAATPASGDVVKFNAGTYTVTAQVAVVTGVTYQGDAGGGTILDCGGARRAFTSFATPGQTGWTLDGLTIINGLSDATEVDGVSSEDGGGLILKNGASGTVSNCTFDNCDIDPTAGDDGSAIYMDGGSSLVVDNCDFLNCDAVSTTDPGGSDGGAIKCNNNASQLTVTNSTFTDCSASDDCGGIDLSNVQTTTTITNCTFTRCTSGDHGGAIRTNNDGNITVVDGCTFTECSSPDDSPAIQSNNIGSLTVTNSIFDRCVTTADGANDIVGMGNNGGSLCHIINNLFVGCTTFGASNRILDARGLDTKVINNTFVNNIPGDNALLDVNTVAGGSYVVANNIFTGNTISADDDLIEWEADPPAVMPTVANNLFFNNTVDAARELVSGSDQDQRLEFQPCELQQV